MARLCFLDTETTSLSAKTGEIWEVGLIVRETQTLGDTRWAMRLYDAVMGVGDG